MANVELTNITPPRVPLIDTRTGLISREWYRFFLNMFQLVGEGQNTTSLKDVQLGPIAATEENLTEVVKTVDGLAVAPAQLSTEAQIAEIDKQLQAIELAGCCAQLQAITAEIQKQIQALEVQPVFDPALISQAIASLFSAPATKTANFAVADNETWLINNKSGSSCTVTLPSTGINIGRVLHFQNYQNQTLVSASSNVVPLAGGTATTAILEAVAGANATLVSNGTSWIMTQYDSNNSLELE